VIDGHIHIERGDYTVEWIQQFVDKAVEMKLDEIWLLEHCYRFTEFLPMYDSVCAYSDYIDKWFHRKAGVLNLDDFLRLVDNIRGRSYPVKIKFGLEICYFEDSEKLVCDLTKDIKLDFLLGSVHFIDNFAFDHKAEFWTGIDVNNAYKSYFERAINLARSGIYNGIAHPDCIKLFGHSPSFPLDNYYEKLAKTLSESNMYAEESSGIKRRCPETATLGMNEKMIRIMKKHDVKIITVSGCTSS